MGWRVLKAAYLVVKDAEKNGKTHADKDPVQWVSLLYDFNTKWMKLEVRESKSLQLTPQMSLILKPNSVNITFASSDPTFIVSVESKRMGNVTLSYSTETFDTYLSPTDVLEWQTLFKSAISPCVTYAVTIVEDDIEQAAILCVTDRTVQLSVAVQATNNNAIKRNGSSVISTNVDGIKLTVEDSLLLTLNKQHVTLRTNRLIELYQHLMSYFTGRRTAAGDFDLANFDYVNTRRGSRKDVLEEDEADDLYLPFENPYGYVRHSPSPRNTPDSSPSGSPRMSRTPDLRSSPKPSRSGGSPLPRRLSSPRNTPDPSPSFRRSQTPEFKFSSPIPSPKPSRPPPTLPSPDSPLPALKKLPKIASHHLPKIGGQSSKPQPPPKPKNAKEILSEFENNGGNFFRNSDEPIYKSVRRPQATISASSIGIRGLSETSNDEDKTPALPPTPPEYATLNEVDKKHGYQNERSGFNPNVEYMNVNPRRTSENLPGTKPLLSPTSGPRRVSEDGVLMETSVMKFPNRQNAIRSPARSTQLQGDEREEEEEIDELYESIYSLGIYSDPLENLPPPRDSWLNGDSPNADGQFGGFPQFGNDVQQAAPRKVLLNKIQRFDKKILRKTDC